MTQLFEAVMVVCFGISWPMSIIKSYKSKSTKAKSLLFLCFILTGYAAGIISKLLADKITYVFVFYVLNFLMVFTDLILYFRNRRYEIKQEEQIEAA